MITQTIQKAIQKALKNLSIGANIEDIVVEIPNDSSNGDYSSNIAMRLASKEKSNPRELAQKIVDNIDINQDIEKIEVAGPGFINFYLSNQYLKSEMIKILELGGREYIKSDLNKGKKLLIEYTDPNPFKVLHVGHLYTNIVGEALSRLKEVQGIEVFRANYQGDVGLHVAKALWGLRKNLVEDGLAFEDLEELSLKERINYISKSYVLGSKYHDEIGDKDIKDEIMDINYYIYSLCYPSLPRREFPELERSGMDYWYKTGRLWCLDYFETLYEKLGTKFDYYFFEGESGEEGYKMVTANIENGIFEKDDGAVIYRGDEEKGLHTRVFINKYGLPTYEAKELGLAKSKNEKGLFDESVVITGSEQSGYFKVVLDAVGRLLPDIANVTKHIPHGMIRLPGMKKMSSRKGGVADGEQLIINTTKAVENLMKENGKKVDSDLAESIAIASIKYAFLRVTIGKDIAFDVNTDIQFDGETGPYLLYVYTRAKSILASANYTYRQVSLDGRSMGNLVVKELLTHISKSRNVLLISSLNYSPSTLCTYLFELGQLFNRVYQEVNILNAPEDEKEFLLALLASTCDIMEAGLYTLGINVVDRM